MRQALATTAQDRGTVRIVDACPHARTSGVKPGLPLTDARALLPGLQVTAADPAGDTAALNRLAQWCARYTPWSAPENVEEEINFDYAMPGSGVWLDITGCAHLMGGEDTLARDLVDRLARAGYHARTAIADTPGAAWAAARFASTDDNNTPIIIPCGESMATLEPLPTQGLRLSSPLLADLHRLGLRTIGAVAALPRESLVTRFGDVLTRRLDQAAGRVGEPISPLIATPPLRSRLAFAEPVGTRHDIDAALGQMLAELCERLAETVEGARQLDLMLYRTDGTFQEIAIGTSRPVRDASHLERLFREKLNGVDPGFGIELMILNARSIVPLRLEQTSLQDGSHAAGADTSTLIDSLANRLGADNIARLSPRASHMPEHAQSETSLLDTRPESDPLKAGGALTGEHRPATPRPIHLLAQPEPIDVMAPVPDHPPVLFRWRRQHHKVRRADGPERIGPEWWREAAYQGSDNSTRQPQKHLRDYYCLEDEAGARYWVFREGTYRPNRPPKWFLHGLFG